MKNPAVEIYSGIESDLRDSNQVFHGIHAGVVEYNQDPAQIGRVKIRIPGVTGNAVDFPTALLPWAWPCFPFGGGFNYGGIMVPPVGSSVWVMFAGGNPYQPVWIGSFYGLPSQAKKMIRDQKGDWPKGPVSMSPDKDTTWFAPPGPNPPMEFLEQVNHRPEHYVPFKTPKGASIDIEDRDEAEKTSFHDRAGQGLIFDAPVGSDLNKQNIAQRTIFSSPLGTGFPVEVTLAKEAKISLVDLGGQSIELCTNKNSNKIIISSKENKEENGITDGGNKEIPTKSQVILELCSSDNKINLEISKNNSTLSRISIDGNTGFMELLSPSLIRIAAENLELTGNVEINGDLTVTKSITSFEDSIVCGNLIETEDKNKADLAVIAKPSV